jgi:glycosyltransferase involved in cell wall biosynthesis
MKYGERKKIVFINGARIFIDHEREIVARLNLEFEISLYIFFRKSSANYSVDKLKNFCTDNSIRLYGIDLSVRKARNPLNIFSSIVLIREIRSLNPDIIYLETFSNPYFAILSSILLPRSKKIFGIHDFKLHPYKNNGYKISEKFYKSFYLKFINNFHLFSLVQAELMKEMYPLKNVFYIKLNLIKYDFPVLNVKSKQINSVVNFLFFGKIFYYKGLDILIEAGNLLAKNNHNFQITIAGSCDDFSEYENLIKYRQKFNLKIRYLGIEEIPDLFINSDYLVLPYREITQSGPLMIALNYGIVPIVSDLDGFKEQITHYENGFLFRRGSSKALAETMSNILVMTSDERDEISDNLKRYVKREYNIN